MMPDDWKEQLEGVDAIYFGAVGWPATVPDNVSLWGSLLKFRREFDQYINLRPVRLFDGVPCPLAGRKPGDIDYFVVRENTEGEYTNARRRDVRGHRARDRDPGVGVLAPRHRPRAAVRLRAGAARARASSLTVATKSNGIAISMPWWDGRADAVGKDYPDVTVDKQHIDILSARFVLQPQRFDVVVASNLFGDILSDLGPATTGTIGLAPSRQPQPGAQVPVAVRAGARLGAGHLRQEHRQPDRDDLVGRADARLPDPGAGRRPRRARRDREGDRARDAPTARARPTSAGKPIPKTSAGPSPTI